MDFAEAIRRDAATIVFTPPCGPVPIGLQVSGPPQPGTTLLLEVFGPVGQPAILVAGLEDYALGLLPHPLPGGCLLEAFPDVVLWHVLDSAGSSRQTVPIPAGPQFLDFTLFAQWLHIGAAISTSEALAIHVGL